MKANDLMMGDYVTFADCIDNPPLILIKIEALGYQESVGENSSLVRIDNAKVCDIIDIDDEIVGIPITPEILEKNGFEKNAMYYVLKIDEDFELWYYPHLGSLRYEYQGELIFKLAGGVNYVHSLQHALRICGIDKEVEL